MDHLNVEQRNVQLLRNKPSWLADGSNNSSKYEIPGKRDIFGKTEPISRHGPRLVSQSLPPEQKGTAGLLPVNRDNERLDAYLAPPTTEQWERFNQRTQEKKLCNRYHLLRCCPDMEKCQYDHRPIDSDVLHALRYVARNIPCVKQGACRSRSCVNGHICQKDGCWGGVGCRFKPRTHFIDPVAVQWLDLLTDMSDDDNLENTSIPSSPSASGGATIDRFLRPTW